MATENGILYKLYKNGEMVYIGTTKNLATRLRQHLLSKDIDCARFVSVEQDARWCLEAALIEMYKPLLNKAEHKGLVSLGEGLLAGKYKHLLHTEWEEYDMPSVYSRVVGSEDVVLNESDSFRFIVPSSVLRVRQVKNISSGETVNMNITDMLLYCYLRKMYNLSEAEGSYLCKTQSQISSDLGMERKKTNRAMKKFVSVGLVDVSGSPTAQVLKVNNLFDNDKFNVSA